jgi:phosphoglycolate phosphatase
VHHVNGIDGLAAVARISAIVCDWNGTIVDDADRAHRATNQVLRHYALDPIDEAAFRSGFVLPLSIYVRSLGIADGDRDQAIGLWNHWLSQGGTHLQPGVLELLETAHTLAIPVGIVSAADPEVVRADARALGIASRLDFIDGSVQRKATALSAIAARSGGLVLYAGDTEYDVDQALLAGALAIGFAGGYRPARALADAGADAVIADFSHLAAALRRWHRPLAQTIPEAAIAKR